MTGSAELAQVASRLLRRPKRDEVAQPLIDWEKRHPLTVALGPERGVQLLAGEAGDEKVTVVHQCVANPGVCQVGGQLRFPHPFGEPEAARVGTKAAADGLMHPLDLFDPVDAGQGGEHRLVETAQEQLDFVVAHQLPELVQIPGVVAFEPFE